ncbi:dirigent protein 22-like [Andrographis paniculata]|uniref:dirigent protein 22-like n=1 Tax=Andrographis paniculata TaxID=175694 RepID=UPI0021E958C5|nr:dirigent protein 22-like [Andrographis paniculata]
MVKIYIALLLITFLLSYIFSITMAQSKDPIDPFMKIPLRPSEPRRAEKSAVIRVYVHDVVGGPNATVWKVATANITGNSSSLVGQISVVDDKLTSRPERNSTEVGRVQGLTTLLGLEKLAFMMNLNFWFTAGEYNGSTLCVVGRNPIGQTDRELSVVGGTKLFRMARGYSVSNTYSYDPVENYGVLEYTLYVYY